MTRVNWQISYKIFTVFK